MVYGDRLHIARWKAGLSLRQLSKKIGISASTLHRAERKDFPNRIKRWIKLMDWIKIQESR